MECSACDNSKTGDSVALSSNGAEQSEDEDISYWELLCTNRNYRLFLCSFLISRCGEWLTYIASIEFIEGQLGESSSTSRTAVSVLVVMRLVPSVLLACFGGTLADARDRRETMVALDISGAVCALLFVAAYQLKSIGAIYLVTFCQMSISGLYQPCCNSIVPLMVTSHKALQKATTLQNLTWSAMASVGSALGGYLVALFGSRNCFCKCNMMLFQVDACEMIFPLLSMFIPSYVVLPFVHLS